MPDITESLTPKSDQLDAVDLANGSLTITVTRADYRASSDQPVTIHLAEFPRPWKPGKNMRRVLAACWGKNTDDWTGRRATLYCDPSVKFGGAEVGGIRISHLDIPEARKVPLILTKGKSTMWPVEVLLEDRRPPAAPEPTEADVAACTDQAELRAMWDRATSDERRDQIIQRKADLDNEPSQQDGAAG